MPGSRLLPGELEADLIVSGEKLDGCFLSFERAFVDVAKGTAANALLDERLHILLEVYVQVHHVWRGKQAFRSESPRCQAPRQPGAPHPELPPGSPSARGPAEA